MIVYLVDLIMRLKVLSWVILIGTLLVVVLVSLVCLSDHLDENEPFSEGEKKFYKISIIVIIIQILFLLFIPSNEILNNFIK